MAKKHQLYVTRDMLEEFGGCCNSGLRNTLGGSLDDRIFLNPNTLFKFYSSLPERKAAQMTDHIDIAVRALVNELDNSGYKDPAQYEFTALQYRADELYKDGLYERLTKQDFVEAVSILEEAWLLNQKIKRAA